MDSTTVVQLTHLAANLGASARTVTRDPRSYTFEPVCEACGEPWCEGCGADEWAER